MLRNVTKTLACALAFFFVVSLIAEEADAQRRRPTKSKKTRSYRQVNYISMHRMAGCGLGSLAFDSDDKVSQVAASFLNGTGMQTFAISFGTSNCTYDGVTEASREKEAFVESNLADISHDIAVGNGEYLSALAALYGCQGQAKHSFANKLHQQRSTIMQNGASVEKILGAAEQAVLTDMSLSRGCARS